MEHYLFARKLLAWLAVPLNFNRMVAVGLRVLATLLVPLSLVTFFKAGKALFDLPAEAILGGILFQMFYVIAIYAVVHTLFIRANDMDGLAPTEHHIFPLASVLAKAGGEALAAYVALVATGGGIYVWFTGKGIATVLNPPPRFLPVFGDTSFMGGIEFMVGGLFSALAILITAYLASALLSLLFTAASRSGLQHKVSGVAQESSEPALKMRSGTGP